jgi:hypothetical protein
MKHRIARISVHQTSKTLAFVYGVLALVILPFGMLMSSVAPVDESVPVLFWLLFPPLYAGIAYIAFVILAAIYNFVAGRVGGVEVQLDEAGTPS